MAPPSSRSQWGTASTLGVSGMTSARSAQMGSAGGPAFVEEPAAGAALSTLPAVGAAAPERAASGPAVGSLTGVAARDTGGDVGARWQAGAVSGGLGTTSRRQLECGPRTPL